jgi:hypothetical protein
MKLAALEQAEACIEAITCPTQPPQQNSACEIQRMLELNELRNQGINPWRDTVEQCDAAGL